MSTLRFYVANSLTGRIVGRLNPVEWSWDDPLTGSARGEFTVPIPTDPMQVEQLVAITRPHVMQICAQDEQDRWWFGGPILGDPERTDQHTIKIAAADWRAWFYAAQLRPDGGTRVEYVRVTGGIGGQVEQNEAIAAIAAIGLDTVGAPRLLVDAVTSSGVMRDVTARMFTYVGEALDNIARRADGPDWHTYIATDPADSRNVVAHLAVSWPERALISGTGLALRREVVLRTKQGAGGNIIDYTWPQQPTPPSRVLGVSSDPPPDETWAVAETPELLAGETLAWDESWQLPEGVTTAEQAFDYAWARLVALSGDIGVASCSLRVESTDLGSWGPGDRARLLIKDGWRDVDLESARILGRKLEGRGENVTAVTAQVNLSPGDVDDVDPDEVVE